MKAVFLFTLLFVTVLCRPVKKGSSSSSESSEELVKPDAVLRKDSEVVPEPEPVQNIEAAAASDESLDTSDEEKGSDTAAVDSDDSADSGDSDEDTKKDEEEEEEESSDSSESGEAETTPAPPTVEPTAEPSVEPTAEPTVEPSPSIIYDDGRGDSMGNPSDYKRSFPESNTVEKVPSPYKSYDGKMTGKTYVYGVGNDIEKQPMKVYKALQVHQLLDEDTSTPEMESQGMGQDDIMVVDPSSGSPQDDPTLRVAPVSQEISPSETVQQEGEQEGEEGEESASTSESSSTDESSSASDAEGESDNAATSEESDATQSSEEATATPGAADSESDESAESQESDSAEEETAELVEAEVVTPAVILAK